MQRDKTRVDHIQERKRTFIFIAKNHCCVSPHANPAEKEARGLDHCSNSTEPSVFYIITCINRIYKLLETVIEVLQREVNKATTYKKNVNAVYIILGISV